MMYHGFTRLYADMEANKKPIVFQQKDIQALAEKCWVCRPSIVRKKFFITTRYSYYLPQSEADVEWAQKVFANNGIKTEVHTTKMMGLHSYKCLRVRLSGNNQSDSIVAFMKEIKKIRCAVFFPFDEKTR